MRKFVRKLLSVLLILCAFVCGALFYAVLRAPVFETGNAYTFYLGANSSSLAVQTNAPAFAKLLLGNTQGESTYFEGDRYAELKERYRAELLFTEEVCGIVNYYLYSPLLGEGVAIGEYRVNLHVAVGDTRTAAGTPLIFGGF